MKIINFDAIKASLSDRSISQNKRDMFKEVLLLVLARATRADSNVAPIEITHVINVLKEKTGVEFSEADILTAASSEIFESQSLERTLAKASGRLNESDRAGILEALAGIIRSDTEIRYQELEFFDHVATALRATPSEICGLVLKN